MAIPNHDITCITKTFPTTCPECNQHVWFFSCSCGSKIFFDELGHPWEQHLCKKFFLAEQIKLIQDAHRLSDEEVYNRITTIEKGSGRKMTPEIEEMIDDILGKRRFPLTETNYLPDVDTDFSGKVMQLNNPVNIFKKLGYDATSALSVKLLGKISEVKWAIASVRSHPNRRNECFSYEIFISTDYLKRNLIRQGDMIAGIIKVVMHPKGVIWQLTELRLV